MYASDIFFLAVLLPFLTLNVRRNLSLSRVSWFMSQFSGFMGNEKYIKSAISFSITFFSLALRKFKILIPIITFVSKISSSSSLTFKTRGFDIYKRQRKITHKEAFFCMVKKSFIISSDNSFKFRTNQKIKNLLLWLVFIGIIIFARRLTFTIDL